LWYGGGVVRLGLQEANLCASWHMLVVVWMPVL